MEQRLKTIGDLADSITTLSQAVLHLAKRVEALEHRLIGTGEGEPFTVPLAIEVQRLDEHVTLIHQTFLTLYDASKKWDEEQVERITVLEEDVQNVESFLTAEKVGSRLLTLEETVANLVTICEEQ